MATYVHYVFILVCSRLVETVERGFVYCPAYPCACESKDGGLIINCRNLYLSSLPKFLSFEGRIKELSLRHNSINNLPARSFQNLHIEKLDMLDNVVASIHTDAFTGLEDSLRWLSIQLYAMDGFPARPLSRLRRLRSLIIVGCKQPELTPDLFLSLTALEDLHLIGCRITHIQTGTFSHLQHLTTLVLAKNSLTFQIIAEINVLDKLINLDLSFNNIQSLEKQAFSRMSKLRNLNLASNNLRFIVKQTFHSLDFSLEELDLRENSLKEQDLISLVDLKILRRLDLSFNKISDLCGKYFTSMRYLASLNLEQNNVRVIGGGCFRGLASLRELNMRSNPLMMVEVGAFTDLNMLDRLNINNTNLGGTFLSHTFDGLAALTRLDVSNSSIVSGDMQAFSRLVNITHLDLSHNWITEFDFNVLRELGQLNYANFSYNNISRFLNENVPTFNSSLAVLDLSWNSIQTIRNCSFSSLNVLNDFRLEGNPLNCNCSMSWLYRWLQMALLNQIQEHYKWTCNFPAALRGLYFSELEFSYFQCSDSLGYEDDVCPTGTSETKTELTVSDGPLTSNEGLIIVNISRPHFSSVFLQWLAEDIEDIFVFNLILKQHNNSSVTESITVSANTTSYTLTLNSTTELDICVVAINTQLLTLAKQCHTVPSATEITEESSKNQLQNLMDNSFLPLMFIYISGSLALAFIVACIVVLVRKERKSPRRVKPLCFAYPAWFDHRTTVSSPSMTHDPHYLNTFFVDNANTHDPRNTPRPSTVVNERLQANPDANLPLDSPFTVPSRRESGIDNRRTSNDTAVQVPSEIQGRTAGDEFFFNF